MYSKPADAPDLDLDALERLLDAHDTAQARVGAEAHGSAAWPAVYEAAYDADREATCALFEHGRELLRRARALAGVEGERERLRAAAITGAVDALPEGSSLVKTEHMRGLEARLAAAEAEVARMREYAAALRKALAHVDEHPLDHDATCDWPVRCTCGAYEAEAEVTKALALPGPGVAGEGSDAKGGTKP